MPFSLPSFLSSLFAAEGGAPPDGLATTVGGWWALLTGALALQVLYRVAVFIAILIAATAIGRLASRAVAAALTRSSHKPSSLLVTFLVTWIHRAVLIFGLVMAIQNAGVEITPLIAGLSIGGIVIGLAVQGTVSNFISGVMLMIDRPFDVDDDIETKGFSGTVVAMTMINTVLNTGDNRRLIIPNNDVWGSTIINLSGNPTRRVDLTVAVAHDADLDAALALIRDLIAAQPLVLKDPLPVVEMLACGESSITIVVRPWVATADYWPAHFALTRVLRQTLDRNGMRHPLPQRMLHVAPKAAEALTVALKT